VTLIAASTSFPAVSEKDLPTPQPEPQVEDIPESILDGRLGEIYERRLSKFFPRSYAWPSLVTIAGVMVPGGQTNLYTALVGPINSGKSQAIEYVRNTVGLPETLCSEVKAGSAEGLLKKLHDDGVSGKYLMDVDEWGHFFAKSEIQGSTLPKLLTTGFYKPRQQATIKGGMVVEINVLLSWLGGIVEEEFESCFTSATTGGLYDRFLFGQCPTGYSFDYRPYEGLPEPLKFSPVRVDGSVYEELSAWRKEYLSAGRAIEIAVRAAHICASADGRAVLHASDLTHAKALMEYQFSARKVLRPNVGDNPNARTESTILNYMSRHAPDGRWVNVRELKRALHYDRMKVGSFVWGRAINNLAAGEDLELRIEDAAGSRGGQRKKLIRLPVFR
jgi:hypothetical protein